ncbi:MAG: hypothetical protein RQ847_00910 [Wenzhouxiangellaceae bacterium]|nr:hypothetical protein [Wenzhouxiangellaceae bacterium]
MSKTVAAAAAALASVLATGPEEMARNVAAYAVLAWLAAQAPVDFGSGPGLAESGDG